MATLRTLCFQPMPPLRAGDEVSEVPTRKPRHSQIL
jgi:hypothetical protein